MQQKRLLMSFAAIAVFIIFWQWLGNQLGYVSKVPPKEPAQQETSVDPAPVQDQIANSSDTTLSSEPSTGETEPPIEEPVVEEVPQRLDTLQSDTVKYIFDNQGGRIYDATLLDYYNTTEHLENVDLIFAQNYFPGQILWRGGDDRKVRYKVEATDTTITYTGSADGRTIKKVFTLNDNYQLGAEITVEGGDGTFQMVVAEGLQPLSAEDELEPSMLSMGAPLPKMMHFTWSEEGDHEYEVIKKRDQDDPKGFQPLLEDPEIVEWAGIRDNYFAAVFLPDTPRENLYVNQTRLILGSDGGDVKAAEIPAVALLAQHTFKGTFYTGPMYAPVLAKADPRLENVITYGWAGALSKWLFTGLKFAHDLTGNWGWAIIILTIIIRTLLVPLMVPSMKSSFKMRALQPKITKLRNKYSGDDLETKQKLSQETFKLYKEEGVNPFSSCITGLAQAPVFFAYFSLLRTHISLRQADWLIFADLSLKDGTFILPILMGVTMFLSTMAMPMPSTDPAQAKMMKIMPVMISVMFIFMPAGLILYMITSNVFTLAQNSILKRRYATE